MKTVQQWFELLPEPHRSQALENTLPGNKLAKVISLDMAFGCGFTFRHSKEGLGYWKLFHDLIRDHQINLRKSNPEISLQELDKLTLLQLSEKTI